MSKYSKLIKKYSEIAKKPKERNAENKVENML